jgi:hypothetical protein
MLGGPSGREMVLMRWGMPPPDQSQDEEDMVAVKRSVRRKRGSWWQVPKDMPESDEDDWS